MPERRTEALLEGVGILFPNFAGEERKFNAEGDRNFLVVLNEEIGTRMAEDGWNVKRLRPRDEDDLGELTLKVNVSYRFNPPRLVLVSAEGRTILDEESCEVLDWLEFDNVDVKLNKGKEWTMNGRTAGTAYLKTIYATIREDELDQKYAHIPITNSGPQRRELTSGSDDIVDGEVVSEHEDYEQKELTR